MKTVKFYSIHKVKTSDAERKEIIERVFKINTNKLNLVVDSEEPDYIITDTGIYRYERCWKEFRKYYSPKRIHILFVDEATFPDMNLFDYACVMNSHFSIDDRVCKIPNDFFIVIKLCLLLTTAYMVLENKSAKRNWKRKQDFVTFYIPIQMHILIGMRCFIL